MEVKGGHQNNSFSKNPNMEFTITPRFPELSTLSLASSGQLTYDVSTHWVPDPEKKGEKIPIVSVKKVAKDQPIPQGPDSQPPALELVGKYTMYVKDKLDTCECRGWDCLPKASSWTRVYVRQSCSPR